MIISHKIQIMFLRMGSKTSENNLIRNWFNGHLALTSCMSRFNSIVIKLTKRISKKLYGIIIGLSINIYHINLRFLIGLYIEWNVLWYSAIPCYYFHRFVDLFELKGTLKVHLVQLESHSLQVGSSHCAVTPIFVDLTRTTLRQVQGMEYPPGSMLLSLNSSDNAQKHCRHAEVTWRGSNQPGVSVCLINMCRKTSYWQESDVDSINTFP